MNTLFQTKRDRKQRKDTQKSQGIVSRKSLPFGHVLPERKEIWKLLSFSLRLLSIDTDVISFLLSDIPVIQRKRWGNKILCKHIKTIRDNSLKIFLWKRRPKPFWLTIAFASRRPQPDHLPGVCLKACLSSRSPRYWVVVLLARSVGLVFFFYFLIRRAGKKHHTLLFEKRTERFPALWSISTSAITSPKSISWI